MTASRSEQLDPALRAAYLSLSTDLQEAVVRGNPTAERALQQAYVAETAKRRIYPNRAARRAATKRKATR
jgi:hypothetical protein